MKPFIYGAAVCLLIALGLFWGWSRYSDFLSQGQRPPESTRILNQLEESGAPDFELTDIHGKPLSLGSYRGKLVLLNFWASWCEPCIHEFPSMMKLISELNGDLILLAISADYEEEDIYTFLKAFNIESPFIRIAWDQDQVVAKKFGTFKLPESYIIGPDGSLIRKVAGVEDWATPEALAYFKDLLASPDGHEPQAQ